MRLTTTSLDQRDQIPASARATPSMPELTCRCRVGRLPDAWPVEIINRRLNGLGSRRFCRCRAAIVQGIVGTTWGAGTPTARGPATLSSAVNTVARMDNSSTWLSVIRSF